MGAVLFLVTASALTIAVIWQAASNKDSTNSNASQTKSQTLAGTKMQNFTPVGKVDKLQTTDTKVGNGQEAKAGDTVTVLYTGAVAATGIVFQSTQDTGQPVSFSLNQVITGWKNGIPGMKVGGERRLLIPAAEAYGPNPPAGSNIPPNADLVFDVTLLSIGK
jgi:FKBP-type peptidyl-prolyl cis-trans isomerase